MSSNNFKDLFISTTDTVVGIGAPMTKENSEAIYKVKGRDKSKKLVIMVSSIEEAREFPEWSDKAENLAKKYWPGATTLVLSEEVAIRIPDHQGLLNLIKEIGPIYMTSANPSGHETMTFDEAVNHFKEIKKSYYFGKPLGKASQIIKVDTNEILRS